MVLDPVPTLLVVGEEVQEFEKGSESWRRDSGAGEEIHELERGFKSWKRCPGDREGVQGLEKGSMS